MATSPRLAYSASPVFRGVSTTMRIERFRLVNFEQKGGVLAQILGPLMLSRKCPRPEHPPGLGIDQGKAGGGELGLDVPGILHMRALAGAWLDGQNVAAGHPGDLRK